MPNIKSAEKRVRIERNRRAENASAKSALRTAVKSVEKSTVITPVELQKAAQVLDKAASKGLIHPNKASRKKSRLAKRSNAQANA